MRNKMLKERIKKEYGTVRKLIEEVLSIYPETRENDTNLYLTCLQHLGVNTIEEAKVVDLNIVTVHKVRQVVQNKEGRFLPKDEIKRHRAKKEEVITDIHRNYV